MSLIHTASECFAALISWLVSVIGSLGYPGIVALMFLESSLFPFPSEVVMPPAGYLARTGEMNIVAVIACGILGSLLGALFNYWIAIKWGRKFFERYGKWFFVKPEHLDRAEKFFARHGHISTFTARLLPVVRQYISLPAGLARMDLVKFCVCTAAGSGIWVALLAGAGYMLGSDIPAETLRTLTISLIVFCVSTAAGYILVQMAYSKRSRDKDGGTR